MINDLHGNADCRECNHFGFCKIYWGPECKRQGGSRTPRLKSGNERSRNETAVLVEVKPGTKRVSLDQPIRTRVVNW
ncbi:MAG: hypothetical protein GX133_11395 [Syntrophomonadaceae bacterium]|nr:hypothetical protein [Syntrophomonadaceae bacterium]